MENEFRVLVCGGRSWGYVQDLLPRYIEDPLVTIKLYNVLDTIKRQTIHNNKKLIIIAGEARGADFFAKQWALDNLLPDQYIGFPADWDRYKKRAGFIRNVQMRDEGKPNMVIGLPGNTGTKMMLSLSAEKGIPCKTYNF